MDRGMAGSARAVDYDKRGSVVGIISCSRGSSRPRFRPIAAACDRVGSLLADSPFNNFMVEASGKAAAPVKQTIIGFDQDDESHWRAELACGHHQHVRHDPPLRTRPWVLTAEGRAGMLGAELDCRKCDDETDDR